jgi:hypothetical protein
MLNQFKQSIDGITDREGKLAAIQVAITKMEAVIAGLRQDIRDSQKTLTVMKRMARKVKGGRR